RNQLVEIVSRPNQRSADGAYLAVVGQDDPLLRLSHHGPVNRCLVRIVRCQSTISVSAVNSDKGLVKKCLADVLLRHISNQGEPVAAETSTRHRHFYFGQVTKFHRDVNRVSNYRYSFAMTNGSR